MSEELNLGVGQNLKEGDIVKGVAVKVEDKAVTVSIEGAPFDGIVPISELSSLHIEKASDLISVGDELQLMITRVEDAKEGYICLKK